MIIIVVKNLTQNAVLAHEVRLADRFFSRLRGLLGDKSLSPGKGLIIYPCKQIHSAFMRFSFDALFLDPDFYVLHVEKNIAPFKISPLIRSAWMVIELPAGIIEKTGTEKGDRIVFEEVA